MVRKNITQSLMVLNRLGPSFNTRLHNLLAQSFRVCPRITRARMAGHAIVEVKKPLVAAQIIQEMRDCPRVGTAVSSLPEHGTCTKEPPGPEVRWLPQFRTYKK